MGDNNTVESQVTEALANFEETETDETQAGEGAAAEAAKGQIAEGAEDAEEGEGEGTDDEPEVDPKDAEIADLRRQLAESQGVITEIAKGKKPAEEGVTAGEAAAKPEDFKWEDEEFIPEDYDFDKLDQKSFNQLLNSAAAKGAAKGAAHAMQQMALKLPGIIKHNVNLHTTVADAVSKFYSDNKDLVGFKKVVAIVAEEISSKQPGLAIEELFEKAGAETRKRLNLAAKANNSGKKNDKKPGGLTKTGGQNLKPAGNLAGMDKEISDMLGAAE